MCRQFKDQMTPMERAIALSKNKDVDRMICNPNLSNGIARILGCKISKFNSSSKVLADAVIATHERFGGDGAKVFTDLFLIPEALGAQMKYPEDGTVDFLKPALEKAEDISFLEPVNPLKDKRLPVHLDAMKIVQEKIGNQVPCVALIAGPFTSAFFLVGVEKMTKMMLKNPNLVHKLCELTTESFIRFANESIKQGVGISIAEPMSSCTVVSPKHFREFSKPYLKKCIDFLKNNGKSTSVHICGKTQGIWNDIVEIGFSSLSIDNVANLEDCKNQIGEKIKIMGNVDPSSIMYAGTEEDVRIATLNCALQGFDSKMGYGIMPGCGLPVETPIKNIDAMLDTAREIGWPVTREKIELLMKTKRYK